MAPTADCRGGYKRSGGFAKLKVSSDYRQVGHRIDRETVEASIAISRVCKLSNVAERRPLAISSPRYFDHAAPVKAMSNKPGKTSNL